MPNMIGSLPNQVPTNGALGRMAFQDPESVVIEPATGANPTRPGSLVFAFVSNTGLSIRMMGTDGVVRQTSLILS